MKFILFISLFLFTSTLVAGDGKAMFQKKCTSCPGANGEGVPGKKNKPASPVAQRLLASNKMLSPPQNR